MKSSIRPGASLAMALGLVAAAGLSLVSAQDRGREAEQAPVEDAQLARGKYLVQIAGCNDCHTPGYMELAGQVPEERWLTGSPLGWRGPWGTTYATNLRLYMEGISEDDWVEIARGLETRPPMPWFGVREMSEEDLRALYVFIHAKGPAGENEPAYLPPDREPPVPYVQFVAP